MDIPNLFKVKRPRYNDANGKRCKKSDAGAIRTVEASADWYADIPVIETAGERILRVKAGKPKPKRKRVKLCRDKRAAREMLRGLIESAERTAAGLIDYRTQTNQPLGPLVDDYRAHLTAKGNTDDYVDLTITRIEAVFDGCQFLRIVELNPDKAATWLYQQRQKASDTAKHVRGNAESYQEIADAFGVKFRTVVHWKKQGAPIVARKTNSLLAVSKWLRARENKSMGASTSNHYVTALRGFGRWLAESERTEKNPFKTLRKVDANVDVRKRRRVLSHSDFAKLIGATTSNGWTFRGLNGTDRAMIYTLAAYTGLRASEIASLTTASFDFASKPATVTVAAGYTKNNEQADQPLREDLALRLAGYIAAITPATLSFNQEPETVWPGSWSDDGAEMIRGDLKAAALPYTDDRGEDYDFHALRHQFITELSRSGVSLRSAQQLARHSKPELTANVYTHLSISDTGADVEKMQAIPQAQQRHQATGTEGGNFGQADGQAASAKRGTLGHKPALPLREPTNEKTPANITFTGVSQSDADGTRTRNHRIDSPVL